MLQKVISIFYIILNLQNFGKCCAVAKPETMYYNLTTTSRVDLYIIHNQRQQALSTKAFEDRLIELKQLYNERIQMLNYNQDLFEQKLIEFENKLNPLELLDDITDFCAQKYRGQAPTLAATKTNFASCLQKANAAYAPLVTAPETTVRNLKNYYAGTFANALKDCKKKYPGLESNQSTCVVTAVNSALGVTNSNTNTFNNQMKTAACSANLKVKEAFDCYAGVLTSGIGSISKVLVLVDNCIAGNEFCTTCGDDKNAIKGRCPYQMSWHLAENDLNSEKITNPFKGVSVNTPCLQINFINRTVELV